MTAPMIPGYSLEGSLDERDIRTLYAACHLLRFSGAIELIDAQSRARVEFVGGDPIDIYGGDTQKIALFSRGQFRMQQLIPDLDGGLTGGIELDGYLRITKPSALWAWASEHRLSCEIRLVREPDTARIVFREGHAETAEVNGQPELAALAVVSSWGEGTFAVRLKPLLAGGLPSLTKRAQQEDKPPPEPRQFDLSRSISVPTSRPAQAPSAEAQATPAPPPSRWLWAVIGAATVLVLAAAAGVLYWKGMLSSGPRSRPLMPVPVVATVPAEIPTTPPARKATETAPDSEAVQRRERLVAKGRQLLAEGHEHTAIDVFKRALRAAPDDAELARYVQQASGALGHAELVIAGPITINGHKFTPPKHIKIVAGSHLIDTGDGPKEVVIARGEKRRLP